MYKLQLPTSVPLVVVPKYRLWTTCRLISGHQFIKIPLIRQVLCVHFSMGLRETAELTVSIGSIDIE